MIVFKYLHDKDYHNCLGPFRFIIFSNDKTKAFNVWSKKLNQRIEPSTNCYLGISACVKDMTPTYNMYRTSNAGAVCQFLRSPDLYHQLKVLLGE